MDLNVVYNDSLFRIVLMLTFSLQSLRLKRMMAQKTVAKETKRKGKVN